MRLLITRPHHQAAETAAVLKGDGHEVVIEPLLSVEQIQNPVPSVLYTGIVVTSTNAIPALVSSRLSKTLPVYAVGEKTAEELNRAGFKNTIAGNGDVASLVSTITASSAVTGPGLLIYPCANQTAHDLPALLAERNIECHSWIVYQTVPVSTFTKETISAFRKGEIDGVLLYSPKTARVFAQLFDKLEEVDSTPDIPAPNLYVLSAAVRQALPDQYHSLCRVAETPNEGAIRFLLSADMA